MSKLSKLFIMVICLMVLVACGQKDDYVQVNKDGTLYEVGNDISFYYPNTFELTSSAENEDNEQPVVFKKENQVLFYDVEHDPIDNELDQKMELYKGELEAEEAKVDEVKEPVLDSGLKCYEYVGYYPKTGLKFTHLVYFEGEYIYIYGYEANENDYDENIDEIIVYLETFSKSTGL